MEEAPSVPPGDDGDNSEEPDNGPRTLSLRARKQVNSAIPIEEMQPPKVLVNDETRERATVDPGGLQRHRAVEIHGHARSRWRRRFRCADTGTAETFWCGC